MTDRHLSDLQDRHSAQVFPANQSWICKWKHARGRGGETKTRTSSCACVLARHWEQLLPVLLVQLGKLSWGLRSPHWSVSEPAGRSRAHSSSAASHSALKRCCQITPRARQCCSPHTNPLLGRVHGVLRNCREYEIKKIISHTTGDARNLPLYSKKASSSDWVKTIFMMLLSKAAAKEKDLASIWQSGRNLLGKK